MGLPPAPALALLLPLALPGAGAVRDAPAIRSLQVPALLPAPTSFQELEPAAMRADLVALEKAIRSSWSYLELREEQGLDLEALFRGAHERTGEALAAGDFAQVLRGLVAELRDGHAFLTVPGEPWPPRRLPFLLCDTAEGLAIERVARDLELLEGGPAPLPGDLVHAIGGRPARELHEEALRFVFASTPGMARREAFVRMGRLPLEPDRIAVEIEDRAGTRRTVVLRAPVGAVPGLDGYLEPEEGWTLSFPRPEVALLRVPTFAAPDWSAWIEASPKGRDALLEGTKQLIEQRFEEIARAGASALVLDLRGNSGGTDLLGIHLARHLMPKRFIYYRLSSRGFLLGWGRGSAYRHAPGRGMHVFGGSVIALIDEGCFSVTDNFLRCLAEQHPDFTAVGRPSGGGTGAPRPLDPLPHSGAVVTLCTMRVYGPAGEPIEGSGTQPDVPVTRGRADLAAGRDPDLEAALRLLEERAAGEAEDA